MLSSWLNVLMLCAVVPALVLASISFHNQRSQGAAVSELRTANNMLFNDLVDITMNSTGIEEMVTLLHTGQAQVSSSQLSTIPSTAAYEYRRVCVASICFYKLTILPIGMTGTTSSNGRIEVQFSAFTQLVPVANPSQTQFTGSIVPINGFADILYFSYGDGSSSNVIISPDCISTFSCVQTPALRGPPLVSAFGGQLTVSFWGAPSGMAPVSGSSLNFAGPLVFYFPPDGVQLALS